MGRAPDGLPEAQDAGRDVLLVSTLETSSVSVTLAGVGVCVDQRSGSPRDAALSALTVHPIQPATFGLAIRLPTWAGEVRVRGDSVPAEVRSGWLWIRPQQWKDGQTVEITFGLTGRMIAGDTSNGEPRPCGAGLGSVRPRLRPEPQLRPSGPDDPRAHRRTAPAPDP